MESHDDDDDRKPSATGSTTPTRRAKPALKKGEHQHAETTRSSSKEKDRHLKWDEAVIEEHDQLRGTRMKIDEPNTPYTQYDSGAESDDSRRPKSPAVQKDSISWDNLLSRLDTVAAVQHAFPSPEASHPDADHSDHRSGVEDESRLEMRQLEFKEHRKRHYNEMELVKKFRAEHPDGVLVDEDADDNADDERD